MQVTQRDIAKRAEVDQATVSYVLAGRRNGGKISDKVCRKVRRVAAELGYVPNHAARVLLSGETRNIGLLVPWHQDRTAWVWSAIAEGVEQELFEQGYDMTLRRAVKDFTRQTTSWIGERRVDAIISIEGPNRFAFQPNPDALQPIVFIELGNDMAKPRVGQDPLPGIRQAVDALARLGHKEVRFIQPDSARTGTPSDRATAAGYRARELGMHLEVLSFLDKPGPNSSMADEIAHSRACLDSRRGHGLVG